MKIAIDIDDTLNIVDRVERAGAYIARKNLPFKLYKPNSNMLVNIYDWEKEDVLEFIRDGGISAYTEAKARVGAKEAITKWRAAGHEIIVLTSRQKEWFGNPVLLSRDWLQKRKIPYDKIVAERWDKGAFCAENCVEILIDDNPDILSEAQYAGVTGVLAVGRHNVGRIGEFRYFGETWEQIEKAVNAVIAIKQGEAFAASVFPVRKRTEYDGWEIRTDDCAMRRANCVRPVYASRLGVGEKIEECERRFAAEGKRCRFRLTQADNPLDMVLAMRGYEAESRNCFMELTEIPDILPSDGVRCFIDFRDWIDDYRAVSGETVTRAYEMIAGESVYATAYENGKAVAVGMGTMESGTAGIADVRVLPEYRRRGFGRKVCERILSECKKRGALRACLQAAAENVAARSLYVNLGFKEEYEYWYRVQPTD